MNVSRIGANNVAFSAAATATKAPVKTQESKKTGAVVGVGLSALAAITLAAIAIKKGMPTDKLSLLKSSKGVKYVQNVKNQALAQQARKPIQATIAGVAERTSEKGVAARMAELAEAFGGTVEHVVQKASIVG